MYRSPLVLSPRGPRPCTCTMGHVKDLTGRAVSPCSSTMPPGVLPLCHVAPCPPPYPAARAHQCTWHYTCLELKALSALSTTIILKGDLAKCRSPNLGVENEVLSRCYAWHRGRSGHTLVVQILHLPLHQQNAPSMVAVVSEGADHCATTSCCP